MEESAVHFDYVHFCVRRALFSSCSSSRCFSGGEGTQDCWTCPEKSWTRTMIACTDSHFGDASSNLMNVSSILLDAFQKALDERILRMQTVSPIYYAGFEVGSGFSGLKLLPADGLAFAQDLVTLPSFLADGDMTTLLKSSDPEATLADVLQQEEYVLTWQDRTYFLGHLLEHGTHSTNAFRDERRYWSEHAHVLLLCLACILIPERCFELRLVTALPVSLYDRTRRQQVRQALSQHYRFTFNGRTRGVQVTCGYVAMEGQGILTHSGRWFQAYKPLTQTSSTRHSALTGSSCRCSSIPCNLMGAGARR